MPKIITLAHQKGGVGKSTTSLNLYGYFVQSGIKTAIVDIDPQGTISALSDFNGWENFHLIRRKDFSTYADLLEKLQGFEVVIIDTPPYLSNELMEVIKITDIVIIPCKASLADMLAIRETIEFLETQKNGIEKFLSAIVLTMTISGAGIQAQVRDYLKNKYSKIPLLNAEMGNRVAYVNSLFFSGNVVDEDTGKAKIEMQNLSDEILNLIANS
ncbi:MAG: ParA family protein [Burkholderiales bacterium]|nr:ParA family protein [Burkholderiales bacterium]